MNPMISNYNHLGFLISTEFYLAPMGDGVLLFEPIIVPIIHVSGAVELGSIHPSGSCSSSSHSHMDSS